MCPRSVAAAGAFYVIKGAAFVEQGAVEFHICHWYVAVGLLLRALDLEFDVASRQARPT
jgi:hypothetical protein